MAAPFDVQCFVEQFFSREFEYPYEPLSEQSTEKVFTVRDMKEFRAQILDGAQKHYKSLFKEILEQNNEYTKQQQIFIQTLEANVSEHRIQIMTANNMYEQIVFEKEMLNIRLFNKIEDYERLEKKHQRVSAQLKASNQAAHEVQDFLGDVNQCIERISLFQMVSQSMSAVTGAPIAQILVQPDEPVEDSHVVSPAAPLSPPVFDGSRGVSPFPLSTPFPVDTEAGVPVAMDAATEIAQLKSQIRAIQIDLQLSADDLAVARARCSELEHELAEVKNEATALSWERQSLGDQLDLARNENDIRAEHVKQLQAELREANDTHAQFVSGQMKVSLDLAGLRKEHDDLQRRLRIAECDRERMQEEKAQALKSKKHLEITNRELKERTKGIKEAVKTEIRKEWERFIDSCRYDAERISMVGIELAEEANEAQVKYYEASTLLALEHRALLADVIELRAQLSKKHDGAGAVK
jgi:chromosome segregation ATPase